MPDKVFFVGERVRYRGRSGQFHEATVVAGPSRSFDDDYYDLRDGETGLPVNRVGAVVLVRASRRARAHGRQLVMTDSIARSVAADEAERSMRAGGRSAWSREDYNAAVKRYNELYPEERGA